MRTWTYPSVSQPGETWTTTFDGKVWHCNCPGFTARHCCGHVDESAIDLEGGDLGHDPFVRETGAALPRLWTGRYQWFREGAPPGVLVVGTTVGEPKFPMKAEIEWVGKFLAPWGLMDVDDQAVFEPRYFTRLDAMGPAAVRSRLLRIARKHPGITDAVLCCYDNLDEPGMWCHRQSTSRWLASRLEIQAREWPAPTPQQAREP